MAGLLEVVVANEADAERAQTGGADRLVVVGEFVGQGRAPSSDVVEVIVRDADIPVRPLLRLRDGFRTDGGEMSRLLGLASHYAAVGCDGFVFGFLDGYANIDREVVTTVAQAIDPLPWTFDRAIDHCLDADGAWELLKQMPGCDQVESAGSVRGMSVGLDDIVQRARGDEQIARMIVASGEVLPEHVPWLTRAGICAFNAGAHVRHDSSWHNEVCPDRVQTWRILLDSQ